MSPTDLSNILPFVDWPSVTPNVILHINDSSFRATSCTLRGDNIKCGGFFWRFKRCYMVACILMHDRFHSAHDVAHGFIEYPAVRRLTKRNSKRHSSHQRFLISCNKLHATREIKSSAVDFSDVLNVVEIHRTFWRFNIVRHSSVHLDARWIPHRTSCRLQIY